ncbi:MAG: zf-HC2 domain-containing protein, partial [Persicimonas sp.]
MSNQLPCEDVQELLFELQRDELSDLKRAEVDEHLDTCPECAELAAKTGEMFEAAAEGDARMWADIDPDPLFERIEAAIAEDSQPYASDDQAKLDEMFEAARTADADTFASFNSDELFDRIAQQTHPPSDADADDQRGVDEPRSRPRRRRVWAAIAAAACATLIAWWGLSPDD